MPKLLIAVVIFLTAWGARGQERDLVRAELLSDTDAATPGGAFTLGVRLTMKPHWHTYWVNPGESGEATQLKVSGPAGFEFSAIQWPLPSKIDAPGGISYGYEGQVLLLIPVKVGKTAAEGTAATIRVDASWLVCKETCIPGQAKLSIDLPVRADAKPANSALFETWRGKLPSQSDAQAKVEQLGPAALTVLWKAAPRKVEWFPISTEAATIESIVIKHEGRQTRIEFKPTVYKPTEVPGGRLDSVLVYEDDQGRHGVPVSVNMVKGKE